MDTQGQRINLEQLLYNAQNQCADQMIRKDIAVAVVKFSIYQCMNKSAWMSVYIIQREQAIEEVSE